MQTPYKQMQRLATFKERGRKIKLSLHLKVSAMLLLLIVIPFTAFFLHPIMRVSIPFITFLQEVPFFLTLKSTFQYATQSCSLWMIAGWSSILYHLFDPRPGVKVIGVSCFAFYLCSLLNMIYSEPRPYWTDFNIEVATCKPGFGMPSTDLFLAIVFYFYLTIQLLRKVSENWLTVMVYVLLVLYLTFTGIGEVVLGEHFPHQVLITASYAFIFLIICLAQDATLTRWFYRAGFNYEKNRKYSVYMAVITIFLLLIAVIVSQISNRGYLPSLWLQNSAVTSTQSKCDINIGLTGSFASTALVMYNLGVLTGSMHTHKFLHEFWWNTPRYKGFVRSILAILVQIGVFSLFGAPYADLIPESDQTTNYVFRLAIPLMTAGYILTGVLPAIFEKCGLTEEDHSQECVI